MVDNKTNLNKATNQNFQLIFPKIPTEATIKGSEILTLNIHGTVVPSMTLANTEMDWQGGKFPMAIAPVTFEPWYTNFEVDADFQNWYKLYKWISFINNNKDRYDRAPSEYWVDASLLLIDNFDKPVLRMSIANIFPTMLGEITLSYREGEQNVQSSVSFAYTRFELEEIGVSS